MGRDAADETLYLLTLDGDFDDLIEDLESDELGSRRPTLERSGNVQALERWDAAAQAPAFADGCRGGVPETCPYFFFYQGSRLALVRAAASGLDQDDWELCFDQLEGSLRLIRRLLETNRRLVAAMVGVAAAGEHFRGALVLLNAAPPLSAEADAAARRLSAELKRWSTSDALDTKTDAVVERAIRGEYLSIRAGIEAYRTDSSNFVDRLRFDATRSDRLLVEHIRYLRGERAGPVSCGNVDVLLNDWGCQRLAEDPSETRVHVVELASDRIALRESLGRLRRALD